MATDSSATTGQHVDVLIVGAGISGIGAACHLMRDRPGTSFTILERREQIGGTWDLFRYPGVRSDSDMYTFGYDFRPWTELKVLADGPSIREYVQATAEEYRVRERIRFGVRVVSASWSTEDGRWTVEAIDESDGSTHTYTSNFFVGCTGYYDYDQGYQPQFPGREDFTGTFVHPQFWPEDLDYAGKKVVVIGSGATAVTIVPAMAGVASHVTMLQRSPTYVLSLPALDKISGQLKRVLPDKAVYHLARGRNILIQRVLYSGARAMPNAVRSLIASGAKSRIGPDIDMRHFTPKYDPWDQRLCVIPDGDLFRALREKKASIVTDTIERLTPTGIRLASGAELEADIIVSATGLKVQLLGGMQVVVDGSPVDPHDLMTYKGLLLENVPNAAMIFGYTNASWTLKVDISCNYLCRLLDHMDRHGYTQVVPRASSDVRTDESILASLNSGYVHRADAVLPRQGAEAPWKVLNNYLRDRVMLAREPIDNPALEFSRGVRRPNLTSVAS